MFGDLYFYITQPTHMRKLITLSSLLLTQIICFAQQPNFIFIVADDLNDYIGVLGGHPQVETPNIDSLAAKGVTFLNAYCNSPGCAPSRTSMLSGRDAGYTQVYNNEDYENVFRNNFTAAENNEEVYTLPQILKDSAGYFTYAIDKVFHSPAENDFDKFSPTCERDKSWNKMVNINPEEADVAEMNTYKFGGTFDFGMIPDSMEQYMEDYMASDSAAAFIHDYANGTINTCDKPFFLALGLHKPHSDKLIPAHYFPEYYLQNIEDAGAQTIYNNPVGAYPYNGLVMPPQPDPMFNDFYQLPEGGLAQSCANMGEVYNQIMDYVNGLAELPIIDPALTEAERKAIVEETVRANYVASYIAAVQFMDAMVGKVMTALNEHPEIAENTIIIFTSDNGFSLGEKRHWTKWTLWETDVRVPLIVVYPEHTENQISKRVVSLLDIYPTVCDMADVNYPIKADGSKYLDGNSFISLLDNPDGFSANVAVSTYRKNAGFGSCYPHYSVRSERFHYIRYQYNNNTGTGACDDMSFNIDEELYDIGIDRQTDPYEWKNLAYDPDYLPMKTYLSQFIPGGTLYNTEPYTVNIYYNELPCLLDGTLPIQMRTVLINTASEQVGADEISNYTFKWTNNLTDEIHYGIDYSFDLSAIPHEIFESASQVFFYLQVIENASGTTIAFKLKQFYLHPEAEPTVAFHTMVIDHTVTITDVETTGLYNTVIWNFGDGYTTNDANPGPHTYNTAGTFFITAELEYGNKCSTFSTVPAIIDSIIFKSGIQEAELQLFPNPASTQINIYSNVLDEATSITILNALGETVYNSNVSANNNSMVIPVNQFNSGMYVLKIHYQGYTKNKVFEVIR